MEEKTNVRFLTDSTDGKDGAKEVIMDYVISWTLRRAQNICAGEKPILYRYCRKFLGKLIGQEISDFDFVEVETWKQESRIDLWVWVKVNNVEHDILIEDKYYSPVHNDQLNRYREVFDDWIGENRADSIRHYWLLTCYEQGVTDIYDIAVRNSGFKILFWDQMLDAMGCNIEEPVKSESDIFNEFWLENW
ncbi:MAG: PD-(D/E)XK nuclease family protein [Bacteroidales bacterium]|nr:PD-(D/E)XK nuclease family protein [Bacteroidales bacterium]